MIQSCLTFFSLKIKLREILSLYSQILWLLSESLHCLDIMCKPLMQYLSFFFANEIFLISTNQAGFRKGHSTTDNLFVLYSLISLYQSLGTKLCCTFVDFRKTFDTVWRSALAKKIQNSGIKGKIVRVILNMYDNIK